MESGLVTLVRGAILWVLPCVLDWVRERRCDSNLEGTASHVSAVSKSLRSARSTLEDVAVWRLTFRFAGVEIALCAGAGKNKHLSSKRGPTGRVSVHFTTDMHSLCPIAQHDF
jgi:hypothetical protein